MDESVWFRMRVRKHLNVNVLERLCGSIQHHAARHLCRRLDEAVLLRMNVGWLLDVHALQLLLLCGSIQHHTARHFSRRLDITALFRKSISGLLLWLLLLLLLLNVNILLLLLLMLLLLLLLDK